jgi:FtsP/CotA-like multicopper oxidase with cupredoxin domain
MMTLSRRNFLGGSAVLASFAAISGRGRAATIPEAPIAASTAMQPPVPPPSGQDYQPVVTLNGWTLPWRMNGEWKEFHLVAEPVTREFAPGMVVNLWGYNGQAPGPTIEASRATRSACSSPTNCPNTRRCIGTACSCRMAWTASAG